MNRVILISSLLGILLFSSLALAETNITLLYGYNSTHWVPIKTDANGTLQTDLNMTEALDIFPKQDNSYSLGTSTLRWANLFVAGNSYLATGASTSKVGVGNTNPISNLDVSGNLSVAGTLNSSIDSSTLFIDATNNAVAIGNTNPNTVGLHVNSAGTAWTTDGLRRQLMIGGSNAATSALGFANSNGAVYWGIAQDAGATPSLFLFTTTGTDSSVTPTYRMAITSGGNVGIGTTSPQSLLHVSGTGNLLNVSNSTQSFLLINSTDPLGRGGSFAQIYNGTLALGPTAIGDTPNRLSITNVSASQDATAYLGQDSTHSLVVSWDTDTNAANAFANIGTYSGNNPLSLQTWGGNVGIGTTSPQSLLHISGSGSLLNISNGTHSFLFVNDTSGTVGINRTGTPIPSSQYQLGIAGGRAHTQGSFAGPVQLRITGTGASDAILHFETATNGRIVYVDDSDSNKLKITGGGATDQFTIDNDGNVGIGTTSPESALHVVGDNSGIEGAITVTYSGQTAAQDAFGVRLPNGINGAVGFRNQQNNSQYAIYQRATTDNTLILRADNNGNGFLMVGANGRLGIGYDRVWTAGTAPAVNADINISNGLATCSYINAGSTAFSTCSSRDFKENITEFKVDNILEKINEVPVSTYNYRNCTGIECNNRLGLVAEDFYTVLNRGDNKHVDGQDVQMALWLAVQELAKENSELKARLTALENGK